jgi:lipopolysaccharide export system protein LptA
VIKGYQVRGDNFEPPNQQQMRSLLQGAEARILANNLYQLNQPKITLFQTNGAVELIIAAPECVYDDGARVVSSPGPLSVRTADGQFSLQGQGFAWLQGESSLIISNRVHSIIHKTSSATTTNTVPQSGEDRDVFSDRFIYYNKTGQSYYHDNVRVVGTNLTLTGGELALALPMTNDLISLSGRPTWSSGQRNGGGEGLEIDWINNVLRATGNAYVKMPGTAIGTNGAGDQSFEVLADNYEVWTNSAVFHGNVRVTQFAGDKPSGKMNCGTMTVAMAADEVEWVLAEENVLVEQGDGRFTGAVAKFVRAHSFAEFTGNPTWSQGARNGGGDALLVDQARSEMTVRGNARMKLPRAEMKTGVTNTTAVAGEFIAITSDEYVVKPGRADFQGHVFVDDSEMKMTSDWLTTDSLTGGETIERITAGGKVVSDLKDSKGKTAHVTADRALYTISDGLMRLTGKPVVQNERGTLTGSIIVWDRIYDLLVVRNEKMTFQAGGSTADAFPSLQPDANK